MRKTFCYKLYHHKRNRYLGRRIDIAAGIWNHCIKLHKRYYGISGKRLDVYQLQKHLTKLKRRSRFRHWKELDAQAIQDITQRIDRGYTLFFKKRKIGIKSAVPGFRPAGKYRSFTLKQAGWDLCGENRIRIGKKVFRFSKSREIEGKVKTVTVKRDASGGFHLFFSCDVEEQPVHRVMSGRSAGAVFGLNASLKFSDGTEVESNPYFKEGRKKIRRAHRCLSSKRRGSNNGEKARLELVRIYKRIADQRRDYRFKLAAKLASAYDHIFLEDPNGKAMPGSLLGKANDSGVSKFVSILHYQCSKTGTVVHHIDGSFPSMRTCSACGSVREGLSLKERSWICDCGATHDRDLNAAINIFREGASSLGLDDARPSGAIVV